MTSSLLFIKALLDCQQHVIDNKSSCRDAITDRRRSRPMKLKSYDKICSLFWCFRDDVNILRVL